MGGVRKFPFAQVIRLLILQLDLFFKRKNRDHFIENLSSNNCFNKSSLSFLKRVNVETKSYSKQQRLSFGTMLREAPIRIMHVQYHVKRSVNIPCH